MLAHGAGFQGPGDLESRGVIFVCGGPLFVLVFRSLFLWLFV